MKVWGKFKFSVCMKASKVTYFIVSFYLKVETTIEMKLYLQK